MYNHYIPQSDGSYRRNNQQRPRPKPEPPKERPKPEPARERPQEVKLPEPSPPPNQSIQDFLQKLFPKGIDTADLLIICLLLLMNKDEEGGLSPMLTLALYFLL